VTFESESGPGGNIRPFRGVTQSAATREFLGHCTVKNLARGGRARKSSTFLFAGNTLKGTRGIERYHGEAHEGKSP